MIRPGASRLVWIAGGAVLVSLAAVAPAIQNALEGSGGGDAPIVAEDTPRRPANNPTVRTATPMAERVATLGILNKRNGLSRDLRMKPGEAVRIGDAVIRLKACDQTEPWEREQLTGGFVQLIVRGADTKWRKVFSGWLYKETPSLNVVEHPVYDVWVKACAMRHPDIGPDTVVMSGGEPTASATRPKAKKSPSPSPEPAAEDSAASSNTM
jgi:hypothetical protein